MPPPVGLPPSKSQLPTVDTSSMQLGVITPMCAAGANARPPAVSKT